MPITFINLYSTKEQALSTRYSPNTLFYNYKGIQLLPNNDLPYIQTTNNPDGVELEDWEVFAVSLCGNFRTDITDKFFIEKVFADNNGVSQISWSLTNVPDLGSGLIYLEVNQLLEPSGYGQTWYSNVFQITEDEKGYTSRIDYRDDINDIMNSVQVQMYWWHDKVKREISSYTETSTQKTKTVTSLATQYERWSCRRMDNNLILKIESLFDLTFMYINGYRCYPFEISEIPDLQGQENDVQKEYLLSVDYSDVYDATEEPIEPLPGIYITGSFMGYGRITPTRVPFVPTNSRNVTGSSILGLPFVDIEFNTNILLGTGTFSVQNYLGVQTFDQSDVEIVGSNILRIPSIVFDSSIPDTLQFTMDAGLVQDHNGNIPLPYNYINII